MTVRTIGGKTRELLSLAIADETKFFAFDHSTRSRRNLSINKSRYRCRDSSEPSRPDRRGRVEPEPLGNYRKHAKSGALRAPHWSAPRHCPHASSAGSACSAPRDERLGDFYGARDKVSVKGLKVPADSRRSFDLAIARIGSTTMLNSAGRRPLNRASIASPTAVSVMTGRRGPCCPIAATGRIRSSFRDRAPENRLLSQFAKKNARPRQSRLP
jgi:hypothetical protein